MKKSRHNPLTSLTSLALAIIMVAALASGCTQPAVAAASEAAATSAAVKTDVSYESTSELSSTSATSAITVTDMADRGINMDAPASKVVALTASDCEILYAIGAGNTLVGRGEYCDFPAEVSAIPSVQSGSETNIEQIIALKPQVVIMNTMSQTIEQETALENAGITVVVNDAKDIAGVYTSIEIIGAITGKDREAANVVSQMKAAFAGITDKSSDKGEKTVYFEVSPLEYGLWTAGSGTFMNELAGMLGLTNIFADVPGWAEVSQEQVIERDPDYIVTITMYSGEGTNPVDEIIGRDGWQDMKAVKNKAILNADSNEISRPGPRLADALDALYAFVYESKSADTAKTGN